MSLLRTPDELLEDIIVLLALSGSSVSIAALAQTCRKFQSLIYNPTDQHLWRNIFLSVFDDPRSSHSPPENFEWGKQFRERVWSSLFLYSNTKTKANTNVSSDLTKRALTTLLSLFETAPTALPHAGLPLVDESSQLAIDQVNPAASHLYQQFAVAHRAPQAQTYLPESLNIAWLRRTLPHGLPSWLVQNLSEPGMGQRFWSRPSEALAFFKLTAYLGFSAISGLESPPQRAIRQRVLSKKDWVKMSITEKLFRIQVEARKKVYNMSYLMRRRHWGPFHPALPNLSETHSGNANVFPFGADVEEEDVDFDPMEDDASDKSYEDSGSDEEGADTDNGDIESPHSPPTNGVVNLPHDLNSLHSLSPPPASQKLYPDWKHLAAIRLNVQSCLERSETDSHLLKNVLANWDALRGGAWVQPQHSELDGQPAEEFRTPDDVPCKVQGWDWAGVTGLWRRCVCWLDYHDLIYMDLEETRPEMLSEATLIIPISLKVVSFSLSHDPLRPVIHIEGVAGGESWAETGDLRRIWGTVGPCGDANVRWSMYSSASGTTDEPEWASEGVQLGGIGSTAGVLGLWTGAEHEREDPIGAWWQWRVA